MPALAMAAETGPGKGGATDKPVSAQADDDEDTASASITGNEIIVTGRTILPGAVETPYAAIESFDEEDIAAYGASSIADLLDAISPQTGSGRGRDTGRPIILVNGQRISSWREMRDIPPEAIKRMDVLPEEVALQFGYPPDKRVVNLILKDHFAATTGAGEYNRPTHGGYDNYELESGIFKIAGPRRYNVSTKLTETSMLTEDERGIVLADSKMPTVAGDPDPRRYRSLADRESEFQVNGTMTQGIGNGGLDGQLTANLSYDRTVAISLSGLDTFELESSDGETAIRTYDDPLRTRVSTETYSAGLGYNRQLGGWQLSVTGDGSYVDTETRSDRNRDTSALEAAALAGDFAIDGALPTLAGEGIDIARNRALTISSMATLAGRPFSLPAGDANLTFKAGYDYSHTLSEDTASDAGKVRLTRGDVSGSANLSLPLTSRRDDFLGAIGDISLNIGGGLHHLSDFGTLTNWTGGVNWKPSDALSFQATYIVEEAAPTLAQLGAPQVTTYNVSVYDFVNSTTALVTATSGGNPELLKEKRRDWKLALNWQLPILDRSNLVVEYFHNRSDNVSESFPSLTTAVEEAFPDRVTRDAYGNLTAIDRRAVTFAEETSSRIRWGINFGGKLGPQRSSARGGAQPASAPASAPASSSAGAGQGMPGTGSRMIDPARFEAVKKVLCAPVPDGAQPDLSALPEPMQQRLRREDGTIDMERVQAMRARICAAPGAASAGGTVEGARPASAPPRGGAPFGGGRRGPPGGRWNVSIYHTWRISQDVRIAPGSELLDQLGGQSLTAGGVPRHSIEAEGGFFLNGIGLRLNGTWYAPTEVDGSGAPSSSDLRFGAYTTAKLRLFVDLGQREKLVASHPFLKGSRLALKIDNLFDSRQKVTNDAGETPLAYQRAYREPEGRVIGIDFRKMF